MSKSLPLLQEGTGGVDVIFGGDLMNGVVSKKLRLWPQRS